MDSVPVGLPCGAQSKIEFSLPSHVRQPATIGLSEFVVGELAPHRVEVRLRLLLEGKLVFLVDATGIPVLLSLLVLIFTSGGEDLTKLPSNRIELYAWPATPNHALQPWPCPWLPHDR